MKNFISILFLLLTVYSNAQDTITKYFDMKWAPCQKDKAVYYAVLTKAGEVYQCTSYWVDKNIVRGRSTFPDTLMTFPIEEQVLYFKNGNLEDSGRYSNDGHTIERIVYYPNGQLALHYSKAPDQEKEAIEAYEQDGKKIKNYIYEKEAEFKGGAEAWQKYLSKNVGTFYSPDEGSYRVEVRVQFVVSAQGFATQAKIIKSSGNTAIDNDAKRLILQSPQWNNAIQYNRPVIAYRIAPLIYELAPATKKN
ncbi:MAG: energy transducer TonB [Chitinophagaceae bacterium]